MRPLVVDIEDHVKTPIEAANAENEAKRASEITRRTLDAYEGSAQYAYWTAWGTWVLVLVGSGGIIAAVETLHKIGSQTELMERQTKVMEGQIALAEAPFRQWLELRDWDAGLRLPAFGEGRKFGVRVNLVNTTSYPITLDEGEIVFDEAPYGRTAWSAGADRFIAPGRQIGIETYVMITLEQQTQYGEGSICVPISGSFSFTDILKKTVVQRFSGRIRRGHHTITEYIPEIDMTPKTQEPERQNPN